MQRLDQFIRDDARLSARQLVVIRVIWGLVALQAAGTLTQQFAHARSGQFFNLPLFDFLPLLPDLLHRALIYSSYAFAGLLVSGLAPRLGAFGMSAILAYVLVSDFFGFRHVWVLLANVFFWVGMLHTQRGDVEPLERSASGRQYSLFAVRGFVALAYLIAGIAKMETGFLSGDVIRFLAQQHWGAESVVVRLITSHPAFLPGLAILSCLIEVYMGIALMIPRLRASAFLIGLGFHTIVPATAWVGHSLNLYFVATYLFFCWNPKHRPAVTWSAAERSNRMAARSDRLQRIDWTTSTATACSWWTALSQSLYASPFILWYVPAWYLLIAVKVCGSVAFLPVCLAAGWIAVREFRWLLRSKANPS